MKERWREVGRKGQNGKGLSTWPSSAGCLGVLAWIASRMARTQTGILSDMELQAMTHAIHCVTALASGVLHKKPDFCSGISAQIKPPIQQQHSLWEWQFKSTSNSVNT